MSDTLMTPAEALQRIQALIRGRLVRQVFARVRDEYEEIVRFVEGSHVRVVWPSERVLVRPRLTCDRPARSTMRVGLRAGHLHQPEQSSQSVAVICNEDRKESVFSDDRHASSKLAPSLDEASCEGLTASTPPRCDEVTDNERAVPLRSSSPLNSGSCMADPAATADSADMLLPSDELRIAGSSDFSEPKATVSPPSSRRENDLLLSGDGSAFVGVCDSESFTDETSRDSGDANNRQAQSIKQEESEVESWAKSLPTDKHSLRAIRSDVLMELLWIEQAIGSRLEYLAIKAKMGDEQL